MFSLEFTFHPVAPVDLDFGNSNLDCHEKSFDNTLNPDIEGRGIIAGFLATVYLAVFLLLVYYFVEFNPTINPFSRPGEVSTLPRPNPIDAALFRVQRAIYDKFSQLWRWIFGRQVASDPSWRSKYRDMQRNNEDCFSQIMVNIADVQMITALAFLISGYCQLANGMLVYHWIIIGRIVWFSTVTHLAVLSCLHRYLYLHPVKRCIRLLLMGCLIVLLAVGTIPLGYDTAYWNIKVECIFKKETVGGDAEYLEYEIIFANVFLIMSFVVRIYKLFRTRAILTHGWIKRFLIKILQPLTRRLISLTIRPSASRNRNRVVYMLFLQPLLGVYIIADIYLYLLSSMLLEVWTVVVGATWGTLRLFDVLSRRERLYESMAETGGWSFGQIVPLVTLLGPLLLLWDYYVPQVWIILRSFWQKRNEALSVRYAPVYEATPQSTPPTPLEPLSKTVSRDSISSNWHMRTTSDASMDDSLPITARGTTTQAAAFQDLLELEENLFCDISLVPLLSFRKCSRTAENYQPFLGYFERSPWFPYIIIQTFLWGVFVTFRVFFLDFISSTLDEHFPAVLAIWSHLADFGRFWDFWGQAPGKNTIGLLFWIFVAAPWCSVLFILLWPRHMYCIKLWNGIDLNAGGHLHGISTSIPVIVFPCLSYFYLGELVSFYVLVVSSFLYLLFCLLWDSSQRFRRQRQNDDPAAGNETVEMVTRPT